MATNNFSAQAVVLDLLRYIGVTGFAPVDNRQILNQPGLDDDDIRRAVAGVNSALQSIQKHGPKNLRVAQRSVVYPDSSTITAAVTSGSKTITVIGPAATLKGCTIMIDGDGDANRIMAINGTALTLLRAYLGDTGAAVSATVYGDCATAESDVQAIEEPVFGSNDLRIFPARDMAHFENLHTQWCTLWGGNPSWNWASWGGQYLYLEEPLRDGTLQIRITPRPPRFNVTFQARLRAERITSGSTYIGVTPTFADPGYYFTSLHDDNVESILLPIARWRFVSGHPAVKNTETASRLKVEYDEAMELLKTGNKLTSVSKPTRARYR